MSGEGQGEISGDSQAPSCGLRQRQREAGQLQGRSVGVADDAAAEEAVLCGRGARRMPWSVLIDSAEDSVFSLVTGCVTLGKPFSVLRV